MKFEKQNGFVLLSTLFFLTHVTIAMAQDAQQSLLRLGIFPFDDSAPNSQFYIDMEAGPENLVVYDWVPLKNGENPLSSQTATRQMYGKLYQWVPQIRTYYKYRLCDKIKRRKSKESSLPKWIDYEKLSRESTVLWQIADDISCYLFAEDRFYYLDPSMDQLLHLDDLLGDVLVVGYAGGIALFAGVSIFGSAASETSIQWLWQLKQGALSIGTGSLAHQYIVPLLDENILHSSSFEWLDWISVAYHKNTQEATSYAVLSGQAIIHSPVIGRYYLKAGADILDLQKKMRHFFVEKPEEWASEVKTYVPSALSKESCGEHVNLTYHPNALTEATSRFSTLINAFFQEVWKAAQSDYMIKGTILVD
ncbi:MAG: hypothetical protein KDD48_04445 [Bdellovibrionales bacterium]|nr:hypothetical protein [Bdellovibrionales bacterium]